MAFSTSIPYWLALPLGELCEWAEALPAEAR